jgi:hypothetical protein
MGDEDTVRWHHWERQLEKARREGMIEGLERAAKIALDVWDSGQSGVHGGEQANRTSDAIRAEIERLKGEQA